MTNYNLGYACINLGFSQRPKKQRITTNRSMIKRTFQEKGLPYASELALLNSKDLLTIMKWNKENNIFCSLSKKRHGVARLIRIVATKNKCRGVGPLL